MAVKNADFEYLRKLIRDRSAIVLEPGKEYLIESRLAPLARREGYDSLEEMVASMRSSHFNELHRKVIEAMTTNETTFFRDLQPFEMLKKNLIPDLIEKRKTERKLNVWSAACSSGQEPYSIAMLIREHFPMLTSWDVHLLATDISQEMVDRTREGRYNQIEISRGLPTPLLTKYFNKHGPQWQIANELRRMIEVRELNLAHDWGHMRPMDIIFMRNVMIYFDTEMKRVILRKLRELLKPGGFLILGAAETTMNLDQSFARVQFDTSFCYQLPKQLEKAKTPSK